MYDELIKGLRICESGDKCDFCPKWLDKQNGGLNACTSALSKDAADAIEELQKQRDEWESHAALAESFAQGWISVAERLPEYMDNVLVTDGMFSGMGWRDWYDYHGTKPREDYWIAPSTNVNELNITHWMPLPQPPESEDE